MSEGLYYADDHVALYHGDARNLLPYMAGVDLVLADPPYGSTGHAWDRWPDGWPEQAAAVAKAMWCFGSMRVFLKHHGEIEAAGWRYSQDTIGTDDDGHMVWEKNTGSRPAASDRLNCVHEHATFWYQGRWTDRYHEAPRVPNTGRHQGSAVRVAATGGGRLTGGQYGAREGWVDDGTRILRSVIRAPSMRGKAIHPTEKPVTLLTPMLAYACPPGGTVLDPFAGSGSTAVAARALGIHTVLIEDREEQCEATAKRLSQAAFDFGDDRAS
jgi:site-specific DNA-methyltransferase (adenine-specific)